MTIEEITAERDAAISERDAARADLEARTAERDAAISERDAARADLETRTTERDAAISERDNLKAEYEKKFGGDDGNNDGANGELDKEVSNYFKNII